jgi:hypothetical protein
MAHLFAENVMGPIDAGDSVVITRCAAFMTLFFNKIDPESVMWFTQTIEVDDDDDDDE